MIADAQAKPICPVVAEVYSTATQSDALQVFAKSKNLQVGKVRTEFGDVAVFAVTVPEEPTSGDGLGTLTGLGSIERLAEFRARGAWVSPPTPTQSDDCVPNPYYKITSQSRAVLTPKLVELDTNGAQKALDAARRLALTTEVFAGGNSTIVRVAEGVGFLSFMYRAQRGDFGTLKGVGILTPPEDLKSLRGKGAN